MKILFVSAEVAPHAYTGGLGEVMLELPEAMAALGNEVKVVMPKYGCIKTKTREIKDVEFNFASEASKYTVSSYKKTGTKVENLFIESDKYFAREQMYMYSDDGERFAFFNKAVLEMLDVIDFIPDHIICNDWQSALIPFLLREQYKSKKIYSNIKSTFIIHNIEYQGIFPKDHLKYIDANESYFTMDKLEYYGQLNYMKTGLIYSDKVITVSPTYAKELYKYAFGFGLDGVIQSLDKKIVGILNGIEYEDLKKFDKKAAKIELQKKLKLKENEAPIFAMVTRLADQKGIELLLKNLDNILSKDVRIVVLAMGKEYYQTKLHEYSLKFPDKMVYLEAFDKKMADIIYKGADIFLMPSLFEPCGLGQIKAMKYGTVPIARRTGGIADTVKDIDTDKEGTGFIFENYSEEEFMIKIDQAIGSFANKRKWNKIMKNSILQKFDWAESAIKYEKELKKRK